MRNFIDGNRGVLLRTRAASTDKTLEASRVNVGKKGESFHVRRRGWCKKERKMVDKE